MNNKKLLVALLALCALTGTAFAGHHHHHHHHHHHQQQQHQLSTTSILHTQLS